MSTEGERRELGRQLERRGLIPDRPTQAAIRAEAEQVARRVEQKRQEAVAAKLLAIRAKADDRIDWPDE